MIVVTFEIGECWVVTLNAEISTILSNFHETKHMIEIAKEKGIPVWIYKY